MLLDRQRSLLFIVDIQERLAPAVAGADAVIDRARILVEAANRLGVPVVASEQYPQGLGHTDQRLRSLLEGALTLSKVAFSAAGDPEIARRVAAQGRDQIVIAGMEAHVCVLQTALAYRDTGREVAVVADAVGSRLPERKALALERMRGHGIELVDSEMVLFEWLGAAGTPEFKELSQLIR